MAADPSAYTTQTVGFLRTVLLTGIMHQTIHHQSGYTDISYVGRLKIDGKFGTSSAAVREWAFRLATALPLCSVGTIQIDTRTWVHGMGIAGFVILLELRNKN